MSAEVTMKKKSGIGAGRAYKIQTHMMNLIGEIYSWAEAVKPTHDDIADRLRERVFFTSDMQKAPERVRAYLQGYERARNEILYREHTMNVHWLDGRLVTSEEVNTITKSEAHGRHLFGAGRGNVKAPEYGGVGFNEYRTPWQRIDLEKSRRVWKDVAGNPLLEHPYDRKFKAFRCSPGIAGTYGPRIYIDSQVIVPQELRRNLAGYALYGNSSSSPDQYSMWEFPQLDMIDHHTRAVTMLRKHGFQQVDGEGNEV